MDALSAALSIKAPRDEVFAFFSNFEVSSKHLHGAVKTEFHSVMRTGLGAEWTEHDDGPDGVVVSRIKVVAFDQPHSYTLNTENADSYETMVFRFTDCGTETLVAFELTMKPKGILRKIFVGLGKRVIFDMMKEDLKRIRDEIESCQG